MSVQICASVCKERFCAVRVYVMHVRVFRAYVIHVRVVNAYITRTMFSQAHTQTSPISPFPAWLRSCLPLPRSPGPRRSHTCSPFVRLELGAPRRGLCCQCRSPHVC